jgi:Kef-type K+ transport system membrane component KefB
MNLSGVGAVLTSIADAPYFDPATRIAIMLAVLLVSGKIAAEVSIRLRQPAVLGELVIGIVLGNIGIAWFDAIKTDPMIEVLAGIGVLFLLFQVGVESTVVQMLQVGLSSLLVAVLGVAAPFGLGWAVAAWLVPQAGTYAHAFVGATLCATSVGITARVLQDLGVSRSLEARIILGAAVVDDVLGLIILGTVSGAIIHAASGRALAGAMVIRATASAAIFLFGAMILGRTVIPRLFAAGALLKSRGVLLTLGIALCFTLSWVATLFGLAPIIGAFAAGLILEDAHFRDYASRGEGGLEQLLQPISDFLVPIFFVLMGLRTELRSFAGPGVLSLAAGLTIAAIVGKQVCSLGVVTRGVNRLAVGIGMIPRGEVGLIFANVGLGLMVNGEPIISRSTFTAIVAMVIATTMITPPALKWSLERQRSRDVRPRRRV